MFESLGTLHNLKHGMIIDGPSKGEVINCDNDIFEIPDYANMPMVTCDPSPPRSPEAFKLIRYHKLDYHFYNKRYYVWSIHGPCYWRGNTH